MTGQCEPLEHLKHQRKREYSLHFNAFSSCNSPEELKGMSLYNARDKIVCGPPNASPSSTGKFVVFLVFMVFGLVVLLSQCSDSR